MVTLTLSQEEIYEKVRRDMDEMAEEMDEFCAIEELLAELDDEETTDDLPCPVCGEKRISYLIWQDDDTLLCWNCGNVYDAD